jgi:lysyl-tRNA synthetase, class II
VRQSVNRLAKAGYTIEALAQGDAPPALRDELDLVSAKWRKGAPERGFSMALDSMHEHGRPDTLLVVARGVDGHVAGFVHLVPSFGPAAMSLERMRRLPDEPNGLMEFVIVRTIELLRDRGVDELSLNFAAFGRWLRAPSNKFEALVAYPLRTADRWFQIDRLNKFNAKFFPRWQPRYLIYPSVAALPRCALAVLWVEGQAPKPVLRPPLAPRARVTPGP